MIYFTFDEAAYRPVFHEGTPSDAHLKIGLSRILARKIGLSFEELPDMPDAAPDETKIFARTFETDDILAQIGVAGTVYKSQIPTFEYDEAPVDYGVVILLNFNSDEIDAAMSDVGWSFYKAPHEITKNMTKKTV
ncbi:hypothetical protein [Pseudolactococcus insecticola]|uniref:Uncharacterized protein n=1 Tax=Pseudolactococcus insecticola TaxID=2709158 RepID=A0A6A0B6M2_9LACT|nr:hypothetical protein [Lactococcus insecticola]GFH39964.1 hypothetical protein Hs20B_03620 [Lactococcus insecticola]